MTEKTEETDAQYLDRVFKHGHSMRYDQYILFRSLLLQRISENKEQRPSTSECMAMFWAFNTAWAMSAATTHIACATWAASCSEKLSALPFTYTDDICQIGEHDVCFSGVELTKDVGEFKAGNKFASAVIDFQGGHLTLEMHNDREHRYSFTMNVGAKHEGHTCTGCPGKIGEPCRKHS